MVSGDPQQRMIYSIDGDNKGVSYDEKQQCVVLRRPIYPDGKNGNSAKFTIVGNNKWNDTIRSKKINILMTIHFDGGIDESEQFFKREIFGLRSNNSNQTTNIFDLEPINDDEKQLNTYEIAEFADDNVKNLVKITDTTKINATGIFAIAKRNFTVPIAIINPKTQEIRVKDLTICVFDKEVKGKIEFSNDNYYVILSKHNPPKKDEAIFNVLALSEDDSAISYKIKSSNDNGMFIIDEDSGRITLAADKQLNNNEYKLNVEATIVNTPSISVVTIVTIENKW